jgi:hypothetical protein
MATSARYSGAIAERQAQAGDRRRSQRASRTTSATTVARGGKGRMGVCRKAERTHDQIGRIIRP